MMQRDTARLTFAERQAAQTVGSERRLGTGKRKRRRPEPEHASGASDTAAAQPQQHRAGRWRVDKHEDENEYQDKYSRNDGDDDDDVDDDDDDNDYGGSEDGGEQQQHGAGKTKKRRRKDAPVELSAAKPVKRQLPAHLSALGSGRSRVRDPRFDDLSGELDFRIYRRSYGFLDEIREKELQQLQKQERSSRSEEDRERYARARTVLASKLATERRKESQLELRSKVLRDEREAVAQGKRPYYPKRSDLREMEQKQRFDQLRKEGKGKLHKYMQKKRKRDAAKERKMIPWSRRTVD